METRLGQRSAESEGRVVERTQEMVRDAKTGLLRGSKGSREHLAFA